MASPLDMEDVDLSETTRKRPDYFHPDLYAEHPPAERPGEKHRGQLRIAHRLAEAGMEWYEVSNWARSGGECQHNLIYWRDGDWWGAGPGAHSHLGMQRFPM